MSSMQTLYCKLLHQEMVPRMFLSKSILEQLILNPKYVPWTLNRQICNRNIEIPTKISNKNGPRKMIELG